MSCWFIPMAIVVFVVRVVESLFGERISFAFKRKLFFYSDLLHKVFGKNN
jgi:hypothetical protein